MTAAMLRGLLEAAVGRAVPMPTFDTGDVPVARGFAYQCRRCDVYGYLGADEPRVCWACERGDRVERR